MEYQKVNIEQEINVWCLRAKSFPEGIDETIQKLHSLIPFSAERKYFGISRPENGEIVYKAAAEILNDDPYFIDQGCQKFVIAKGEYIFVNIYNFTENFQEIGQAFDKLTAHPDIDPDGYCLEWYLSEKDMKCMVKLR